MAARRASEKTKSRRVFGHARRPAKMLRVGIYARVSTGDQQTIPLQIRALREYAARRGWIVALQAKEIGSGASQRKLRDKLLDAARRREIDVVLVWRLHPKPEDDTAHAVICGPKKDRARRKFAKECRWIVSPPTAQTGTTG
jgi:hypothetical protein